MFTAQDDIDMMSNPERWPYHFLPVKNYQSQDDNDMPIAGLMLDPEPRVHLISMTEWTQYPLAIFQAERVEYESFEAMVEDGWMVD